MAVEIPVVIDIMGGIDDAVKQIPRAVENLQTAMDSNKLEAKITIGNIEQTNKGLEELNAWYRELENADWDKVGSKLDLSPFINQAIMELKSLERQINELQELRKMEGGQGDFSFAEEYKRLNSQVESVAASIRGLQAAQTQLNQTFNDTGFKRYIDSLTETNDELRKMRDYYAQQEPYWEKYDSSINAINGRLSEMRAQWNAMTKAERESSEGTMLKTFRAQVDELENEALTLDQLLQREQRRNQLVQEGIAKRKYENAILNTSTKTLAILQEKERILSERLNKSTVGSSKYETLKQQLKEVRKEIEEIQRDLSDGTNVALEKTDSRLASLIKNSLRLVAIHSARTFIRNVREVTAEFEMQRVALAGIIQDTAQAESLFKQIKAAAIKSPFEIKDLVSYTKQLSAYRIETDKLFDVTTRLADVSAGLGVDMSRLVLAYGQVRAAAVLRGQELRQFTEAGIPLVDLLAKKFTELNGRVTTTADVFELISKRAVSFSMIEEIFNDMTDAGGIFYKMQEKQSETLKGQWMKLKDALSIMYDEIGNTSVVHGAMEKLIADAMKLMQNWRLVAGSLKAVVIQFGVLKLASMFMPNLTRNTKLAKQATDAFSRSYALAAMATKTGSQSFTKASERFQRIGEHLKQASLTTNIFKQSWHRMVASMLSGGWIGLVITALTALIGKIIAARQEAARLGKELSENVAKGNLQIEQAERNFKRLADAAVKAADGSAEQREALKELQRTYGEMIPSQDLQIEKLRAMKGDYEALTAAIREKIQVQTHEQNINQITDTFGKNLGDIQKELEKFLKEEGGYTTTEASRIIAGVNKAIDEGLLHTEQDFFETANIIENIIEEQTGKAAKQGIGQTFQQISSFWSSKSYYEKLLDATKQYNEELGEENDRFKGLNNTLGKYQDLLDEVRESIKKDPEGFSLKEAGTFEYNEARWKQAVAKYKEVLTKALGEGVADAFKTEDYIDFGAILDHISLLDDTQSGKLKSFVEAIQKDYKALAPQEATTRLVTEAAKRFAEQFGLELSKISGYLKDDEASMKDYAKTIEEAVTAQKERITELEFLRKNWTQKSNYIRPTPEDIAAEKDELLFLEAMQKFVQEFVSTGKSSPKKSALAFLKEDLKNVQEIYKKYKEFVEYLGEGKAQEEIKKIYGNVTAIDFLDPTSYKARIEELLKQIRALQGRVKQYNHSMSEEMFQDIKETIKRNEGLRLEAYKLPGEKYYTIGYGFYKSLPDGREITEGMKLTTEEAEQLLDQYIKTFSGTVDQLLAEYGQGLSLTERQFNVLVDLAYQGPAALKKALIKAQGDTEALAEALKDAAWPLVAPNLQDSVKKRDMKRYAAFIAGMGSEEDAADVIQTIFDAERVVQDVDWDELKDALEERLKNLSEEIKRSEAARNFYNNMLDLTGNEDLAASLSVSVYGSVGKDFKERIQDELMGALEGLKGDEIDKALLSKIKEDVTLFDTDAMRENLGKLPEKVREIFKRALDESEQYNANWLIDFEKTYAKAASYQERVSRLEAQRTRAEQEAARMGKSPEEIVRVTDYFNRQIAQVQLEALKDTYTWTKAFEDLDGVSTLTLNNLIKLIDEYIAKNAKELEPQQLKELTRAKEQAKAQILQRNAYNASTKAISRLISARKAMKALEISGIKTGEDFAMVQDNMKDAIKDLADALSEAESEINEYISSAKDLMSVFATSDDASYFGEQLDNLSKTVSGIKKAGIGVAQLATGQITPQAIMQTATGIADVVSSIFGAANAAQARKVTKEIDSQNRLVEDLEESYDNLSRAMDKAFGNDYVYNYSQQLENLIAQQEAYQKQVDTLNEASSSAKTKKKKEEFREQAQEAEKEVRKVGTAIDDLKNTASSFFAGEDLSSAAESFADAWLSAYQEFGDTSQAIEERMTEMVQNIMKKAALSGIAESVLGGWYESLADVQDWNAQTIAEKWREAMALVDPMVQGMQTFANSMQAEGMSLRQLPGQFTGIKRDLAGASEESINGLAVGFNVASSYLSFINDNVAAILAYLTGGAVTPASTATGAASDPYKDTVLLNLASLPQMRDDLYEIRRLLSNVIKPTGTTATHYVATNL